MNPRAAVSWYPVNKVGKSARFCAIFKRRPFDLPFDCRAYSANRNQRHSLAGQAFAANALKQKGRRKRRPFLMTAEADQYRAATGAPKLKR
jgi:hypothetical protein